MPGRKVRDYMTPSVLTLREGDRLRAAVELELVHRIRHIPVLDEGGSLVGIVTDRDIKRALPSPLSAPAREQYEALLDSTPIARVMTREPYTVEAASELADAVQTMLNHNIGGLPVVEGGALVGMFTQIDALRGYVELLKSAADVP